MHLGILFVSGLSLFPLPAASIIAFNHYTQIYFLIKPTDERLV